jgi:hypothetical protein
MGRETLLVEHCGGTKINPVQIVQRLFLREKKLQKSPYFEGKKVTCRHI